MGKRQHQKDKLYLTTTEYTYLYGGRRPDADTEDEKLMKFRRLPFNFCCLSFQPFEHPYCTQSGYIFELSNIVPFLSKYKIDPINGQPLDTKSLVKLNFAKATDGFYQCPVLFKVFNENSHIVAIKTTGNVYSYEAIEQLNIKAKNFRDLLTDEPFVKKDIITIQDPANIEKQNAASYYHIINKLRWTEEEEALKKSDPNYNFNRMDLITKATLAEISKTTEDNPFFKAEIFEKSAETKPQSDLLSAANYSTGTVAASLTSTAMVPQTKLEAATIDTDTLIYSKVKNKGYVQLLTNHGPLNLELFCNETPKTCHNFIELCKQGYYDNVIFHRLIRNFMIQGGDPTGTGTGGQSIWEKPFEDEFKAHLIHSGRGILSMANSGPNTNKSQFFITFRSCKHLDKKHSVFGRVVGGLETLDRMEKVETDDKDKPLQTIQILRSTIFINPFEQAQKEIEEERAKLNKSANVPKESGKPINEEAKVFRKGVGSFIDLDKLQRNEEETSASHATPTSKKKTKQMGRFGDFSSW